MRSSRKVEENERITERTCLPEKLFTDFEKIWYWKSVGELRFSFVSIQYESCSA